MKKLLLVLLSTGLPIITWADTLPNTIPSSAESSRLGQQLQQPTPAPSVAPNVVTRPTTTFQPSPGSENIKFNLKTLTITGNTAYNYQDLLPLFQTYLGKQISLADLQRIAHNITLKYRNTGYILSRAIIPPQKIDNGHVNITIIEGYVGHVHQVGYTQGVGNLLNKYGQKVAQSKPLNTKTLERYALLANDIPGMNQAKVVLQSPNSPNAPIGSTELTFIPDFSKANGYISYDNRGTKYLGQNEFSAGGNLNSLIQSGDQLGFQGLITPNRGTQYINVFDIQPLGSTGATFNLSGNYSKSEPAYTLAPLQINGVNKEISGTFRVPILRSRQQNLYTNLSFDYLNNTTDFNIVQPPFILYQDRIRSVRLGLDYYIQDSLAGANQATVQLSHGVSVLGANSQGDALLSRVNGNPQYTKVNGSLSRLQGITQNTSFLISGIGQYTNQPLLSAEQFSLGGAQYGQAYDPSELTGDKGAAAKAELRYNTTPKLSFLTNIQYFTFYDIGKVWNIEPQVLTGIPNAQSLSSTGVGLRVNFNPYVSGSAEFAQPLTKQVNTNQSFAPRFFVSLTVSGKTPSANAGNLPGIDRPPVGYTGGGATNSPAAQIAASSQDN